VKRIASIGVTLITLALSAPAWADYQTGVDAYQSGDFKTAMTEWLPLAEGGDATAQNSVGALYDHGLGVDESDSEAAHWYQLAADQGLPLAMRNLAGMYAGGYGVAYDKDQAEYWYGKAAEAGDETAAKRLAVLNPALAPAVPSPAPEPAPEAAAAPMTVAGDGNDEPTTDDAPLSVPTNVTAEASAAEPAPVAAAVEPAGASDGDLQYGEGSAAATGTVQQANVAAPPAPQSDPGNWIIGQWQGPSLGCPPGGGLEFVAGETRSYFGGRIAATLAAAYQVNGDIITVVTTGIDGVGHSYQYKRTSPDRFVIAAVPPEMPNTMIGTEHRRCGAAPTQSAAVAPAPAKPTAPSVPTTAAAATPAPSKSVAPATATPSVPTMAPSVPTNIATQSTASVAPSLAAAAPSNAPSAPAKPGTPEAGWDAFGRGDYQGALAIWTPLAEAGDPNMQVLVGSIYDYGQGVPQDDAEAVKWYEMAANKGNAKAQYQAGAVYARSPQIKDPVQGYKWLTIAAKTIGAGNVGGVTADQATTLRTLIAMSMSKAEIDQAEAAAAAFKAK
jgi:TPR repeat protein